MNRLARFVYQRTSGQQTRHFPKLKLGYIKRGVTNTPLVDPPKHLIEQTKPPAIVQYLGYGGTIPFLAASLLSSFSSDPTFCAHATQLYGASILSFLGGVHWGVALRLSHTTSFIKNLDYAYAVAPSLVAWSASLMQPTNGLFVLGTGFAGSFVYDNIRFRMQPTIIPAWYLYIRTPLTIAALGGCCISYMAMQRLIRDQQHVEEGVFNAPSLQTVNADSLIADEIVPATMTSQELLSSEQRSHGEADEEDENGISDTSTSSDLDEGSEEGQKKPF